MILEIPEEYTYYDKHSSENYAYEENGILYIDGSVSFERLMYNLTYKLKNKKRCFYCNRKLNSQNRTLDHRIPVSLGGITLPINLEVSCKKCNEEKGSLTTKQYEELRELCSESQRRKLSEEFALQNERTLESKGFCIPTCWINIDNRSKIFAEIDLDESYKGKRYKKIKSFYKKYHRLPRPIIISSNNVLLDGYLVLMFAKNKRIKKVPVIILDNVIVK